MEDVIATLSQLLVEAGEKVGRPLRACCLFSTGTVVVVDATKAHDVKVLWGKGEKPDLPAFVTICGPNGMASTKIMPGPADEQPHLQWQN